MKLRRMNVKQTTIYFIIYPALIILYLFSCASVKASSCVFKAAGFLRCRPFSDEQASRCQDFGYFRGDNLQLRKARSLFIYCRERGARVCVCSCSAMDSPMQMLLGVCKYSNITRFLNMDFIRKANLDHLGASQNNREAFPEHRPTPWAYSRSPNQTVVPLISNSRHNSIHSRGIVMLPIIRGSGGEMHLKYNYYYIYANRTVLQFDPSPFKGSLIAALVSIFMIMLVGVGLFYY